MQPSPRKYPAIVACMNNARLPEKREIELVAARIWAETKNAGAPEWANLFPGSADHRKIIRIALAALGVKGKKAVVMMARGGATN
ncbi:hypothetical protein [Sphingomonas paeninsulae]|nr:hypothetical protein [Sphingomonas paeninsulae]